MNLIYPVIFTEVNDKKKTVLVEIPDLNGITEGYGIADAISMAKDYIGTYSLINLIQKFHMLQK